MTAVFLHFLNMSITAGWIVLAVLLLRLCLKRAPRWITCLLWGLVALRLVLPISIESALSLIPSAQTVPSDIVSTDAPSIDSGVTIIDRPINHLLQTVVPSQPVTPPTEDTPDEPSTEPSVEPSVPVMEQLTSVAAWVWVGGIALMLLYEAVSVWRLRRQVFDAICIEGNLWRTDRIQSPFILGFFRPRIYLPYGLDEETTAQVLAHERAHLHRRDHWVKPFAFTVLAVYWFNPLLWVAYVLLCRDIEIACDQRVIRGLTPTQRQQYAIALLSCGVERRSIAACPLAFGEVSIKQRIKTALHYRKPLLWVIVASLLVCSVAAVCLLTVPRTIGQVLDSRTVEPDQDRQYYSTDIDGTPLTDAQVDWMWDHAENRRDREDAQSIPLVVSDTADEMNEFWQTVDTEYESTMLTWFDLDRYDDAFFEDNALIWMYLPDDGNGYFDYSAKWLRTTKGVCYEITKDRSHTSTGGPVYTCNRMLLFEVSREEMASVRRYMTTYVWAPAVLEERYVESDPLAEADLDGDRRPETVTVAYDPEFTEYQDVLLLVRREDGTILLKEQFGNLAYAQFYLYQPEKGLPNLLLVEDDDSSERFVLLSLEGGVRSVADRYFSTGGRVLPYAPLNFSDLIPYVHTLTEYLQDATLLCQANEADRTLCYGDTLDSADYVPLSWLEAYRKSEEETLPDILENIVETMDCEETCLDHRFDMDGDGRKEELSLVTYSIYGYSSSAIQNTVLMLRDSYGVIVNSFNLHSYYYSGISNDRSVSVYSVQEPGEEPRLLMVSDNGGDNHYASYLTMDGNAAFHSSDYGSETYEQHLEEVLNSYATLLLTIDPEGIPTDIATQTYTYRPSFFSATYRIEVEVETNSSDVERVRSLSVWNKRRTKRLQTFQFADFGYDEYEYALSELRNIQALYMLDVTFDGRDELLIPVANSARYEDFGVFLWDQKNKQFDWLTTPLRNPVVDEQNKFIRTMTSGDQIRSYTIWVFDEQTQDFVCTHSLYFAANEQATGTADAMRLVVTENEVETVLLVPGEPYALDKTDPQVAPYYEDGSFWDLDSELWGEVFYLAEEIESPYPDTLNAAYPVLLEKGSNYHLYTNGDQLEYWYCVWDIDGEVLDSGTMDYRSACRFEVVGDTVVLTYSGGGSSVQPIKRYYDVRGKYASGEDRVSLSFHNVVAQSKKRVAHFAYDKNGDTILFVRSIFNKNAVPIGIPGGMYGSFIDAAVWRTESTGYFDEYGDLHLTYYLEPGDRLVTDIFILSEYERVNENIMYNGTDGVAESVTNQQLYAQVINGDRPVRIGGKEYSYLSQWSLSEAETVTPVPGLYTLVDLDGDDQDELVLELNNHAKYLILRLETDAAGETVVYGYSVDVRAFISVKTDGTFIGSEGADVNTIYRMTFNGDSVTFKELALHNGINNVYRINGGAVSQTEASAYFEDWYASETCEWIALVQYLPGDTAKGEAYNKAISAYNDFLSGQISATDITGETTAMYVTDMWADIYDDIKGPINYGIFDVTKDGVPELLTESYYGTLDIFTVLDGRLTRIHHKAPGLYGTLLSSGALLYSRSTWYEYVVFNRDCTTQTVTFGERSYESYYFEDEEVTKEEYERLTASYFAQNKRPAYYTRYKYSQQQVADQLIERYYSRLENYYADRDAHFTIYDMNNDGIKELLVQYGADDSGVILDVYSGSGADFTWQVSEHFYSGTSRFLLTNDPAYPGLIYYVVGGGKEQYYYLSLDKLDYENWAFVHTPLWTENYGEYKEGESGRITELSKDKELIELSRKAYENSQDVLWTDYVA